MLVTKLSESSKERVHCPSAFVAAAVQMGMKMRETVTVHGGITNFSGLQNTSLEVAAARASIERIR